MVTIINADVERGFDVMRGKKVLKHFNTYAEADAYAKEKGGRYIRYWKSRG